MKPSYHSLQQATRVPVTAPGQSFWCHTTSSVADTTRPPPLSPSSSADSQDSENVALLPPLSNQTNLSPGDAAAAASSEKLSREERRRRRRATSKYRNAHATRERIRVQAFNTAFSDLRKLLPTLPPDKKMSKIEILNMAICYISYLSHMLYGTSYGNQ